MKRSPLGPAALGFGVGLVLLAVVMLIVGGYRLDERGEGPYRPESYALWGSLFGGVVLVLAGGVLMARRPKDAKHDGLRTRQH